MADAVLLRLEVKMIKRLRRFLTAIVGFGLGMAIFSLITPLDILPVVQTKYKTLMSVGFSLVVGLLFFILEPLFTKMIKSIVKRFEKELSAYSQIDIILGSVGLLIGFMIAFLVSNIFERMPIIGPVLAIITYVIFGLLGMRIGIKSKAEIANFIKSRTSGEKKEKEDPKVKKARKYIPPKVLDTSVIIDGRIADICATGFIEGKLVVPQFVLDELRHIADSADDLKRVRGRRGLDILNQIQEMKGMEVEVTSQDFDDIAEVDIKLLKLASVLKGKVVTNDYNLNKVAQVQGVEVLNINELANAVKPVAIPGEEMKVTIVKEGKENQQGVAYLDDGTMIVVENGRRNIGETRNVVVTSILQTPAGRMIFARIK